MGYNIFYSYQSDIPKNLNRDFIREAINTAISQINGYEIEPLIEGFYGVGGNPPLADKMLQQSQESDIFIGDVTFTSSKVWHKPLNLTEKASSYLIEIPKGDLKPSPNPNVLLETGFSWALKSYERTILVMNKAFGEPENLPVDMGDKRHPITYNLSQERHDKAKKKKKEFERLTNALHDAILTVLTSDADYQRKRWTPLLMHNDWYQKDFSNTYRPTALAKDIIMKLRKNLENKEIPQRIVGPKNTGKTRLAYEFYKEINSSLPLNENLNCILYFDLKGERFSDIVKMKFQDLKNSSQRKILILDNCPLNIHNEVFNEIPKDSKISLLTIGDTDEGTGATFFLNKEYAQETIGKISNETGNPNNTDFIIEKSNGNLREAISMIGKIPEGESELSEDYITKWTQILGAEYYSENTIQLLEELSLYSNIGFYGRFQHQSEILIKNTNIESRLDLEKIIQQLSETSIVKVTGDFIILEAFIVELAVKRLERLVSENLQLFFENIGKFRLSKQFSKRFIEFRSLEGANNIIKELSKDGGLLEQYDFVTSDEGAKILMSISEIEPEMALEILTKSIGNKNKEELIKLDAGRRNIVWTLERLLYREETFEGAATLLFKLSVAENEEIANNASSQFSQLFQVRLPGTTVTLKVRQDFIEKLVEKADETTKPVLINALDRALMTGGFIRMGVADKQAGETFTDYTPSTQIELLEYYKTVIQLLEKLDAIDVISNKFNAQITEGNSLELLNTIERLTNKKGNINKDLRQQFEFIINDPRRVAPDTVERINKILEEYSDHTIREKLEFKVALGPYAMYKNDEGEYVNKSEEKVVALVKELTNSGNENWLKELDILLQGEQHLTFKFGEELSILKPNYQEFLDEAIKQLIEIPAEIQNNIVVDGYLSQTEDKDFKRSVIDSYLSEDKIAYHAIKMTRFLEPELEDLKKTFGLISKNTLYLASFQFVNLKNLEQEEIVEFIEWLKTIEPYGYWVAIDLAYQNFGKGTEIDRSLRPLIKSLFMKKDILKGYDTHLPFVMHELAQLFLTYSQNGLESDLVEFLSQEMISASKEMHFNNEYHIGDILERIIKEDWSTAWGIIGREIIKQDYYGWYNLKNILKNIKTFDNEKLLTWTDEHPDKAPQKVFYFVKQVVEENGQEKWSPIMEEMFKKYYTNKDFLSAVDSDLHSYSWSGSLVPILEQRKLLAEQLLTYEQPKIKEFARKQIDHFNENIKREKRSDQNEGIDF